MREVTPVTAFGSWPVTEIPLTIEYSLDLLEQIRAAAQAGRTQLSRGGMEVGGVLFGTRLTRSIRILAWRPIACEYARGPALLLSPNDRTELAKLLQNAANDPELTGLYPLGWFVSHTKGGVEMTAADQKIYRQYFPFNCQTTLVLQPAADGSARATFFARDSSGKVQPSKKAREFTIQPDALAGVAGEEPEVAEEQAPEVSSGVSQQVPHAIFKAADGRRVPGRGALRDYRAWIWMVPALLALIVLGMMLQRRGAPKPPPAFSLHANDVGGDLRLEWDRNADILRDATRGTLDIKDGNLSVPLTLDAQRLRDGFFNYARISGDVEVRMIVYPAKGPPVKEFAKFVGPPGTPRVTADETAEVSRERDRLKAEVEQLRESVRRESARNRQLEATVRILEQRVQVQKLLEPKK